MVYFQTRSAARAFKSKNAKFAVVDTGESANHRRWAVVVLTK